MEKTDELLADFIGKRLWNKDDMKKDGREQQWKLPMCDGYYPTVNTMKFHSSWDWIMPAAKKFSDIQFNEPANEDHSDHCAAIGEKILDFDLPGACEKLVAGIKWYNAKELKK